MRRILYTLVLLIAVTSIAVPAIMAAPTQSSDNGGITVRLRANYYVRAGQYALLTGYIFNRSSKLADFMTMTIHFATERKIDGQPVIGPRSSKRVLSMKDAVIVAKRDLLNRDNVRVTKDEKHLVLVDKNGFALGLPVVEPGWMVKFAVRLYIPDPVEDLNYDPERVVKYLGISGRVTRVLPSGRVINWWTNATRGVYTTAPVFEPGQPETPQEPKISTAP